MPDDCSQRTTRMKRSGSTLIYSTVAQDVESEGAASAGRRDGREVDPGARPGEGKMLDKKICDTKVDFLMQAFETQRSKRWFDPQTFLGLMRLRGMECNAPSGYAEAFYCRKAIIGLEASA